MAKATLEVKINSVSMGLVRVGGVDVSNQIKAIHLIAVAGRQATAFLEVDGGFDIECSGVGIDTNSEPVESAVEKANRRLDKLQDDINRDLSAEDHYRKHFNDPVENNV